jgi:hypothetical protein
MPKKLLNSTVNDVPFFQPSKHFPYFYETFVSKDSYNNRQALRTFPKANSNPKTVSTNSKKGIEIQHSRMLVQLTPTYTYHVLHPLHSLETERCNKIMLKHNFLLNYCN